MAYIRLRNVGVSFPIYNMYSRSLRRGLFKNIVGGKISTQHSDVFVQALAGINLELKEGDRLGIIGHNGAGKTTLLRALSGVYEPTSGDVKIKGQVSTLTDITLGMNEEGSGYENIITRGIFMGMTFSEIKERVKGVAEFSELGSYLDLPIRTYSTGMALRLAFAVATCKAPEILILDEMIGAGDATFIEKAKQRTDELIENVKILVLASHNMEILKRFCNKAIKLEKGKIVAQGSVEEVLSKN